MRVFASRKPQALPRPQLNDSGAGRWVRRLLPSVSSCVERVPCRFSSGRVRLCLAGHGSGCCCLHAVRARVRLRVPGNRPTRCREPTPMERRPANAPGFAECRFLKPSTCSIHSRSAQADQAYLPSPWRRSVSGRRHRGSVCWAISPERVPLRPGPGFLSIRSVVVWCGLCVFSVR